MDMSGSEHAGHDHSAHAGSPESSKPAHGTFPGHVLPGSLFIIWSLWWTYSVFRLYLRSNSKSPFRSRAWYEWQHWPLAGVPLEPFLKVAGTFIGINAELWAGHTSYRNLYNSADGRFEVGNLQDWQHSAMYSAFLVSGLVDLLGHYTSLLPPHTEHVFLALAFLVEGTLFGFHLKGTDLDKVVHIFLVITVLLTVAALVAEIRAPHSLLLAQARACITFLQGCWFIQAAHILFKGKKQWDPNYMGGHMFVPVVYVTYVICIAFGTLLLFVGTKAYCQWALRSGRPLTREASAGSPGLGAMSGSGDSVVEVAALLSKERMKRGLMAD